MNQDGFVHPVVAVAKRGLDLLCVGAGVALTLPIWPIIALAIKLDSPGPVLFKQIRVGRAWADRTELFWMYKFRSMRTDAEAETGPVWARKNDPRITRVGGFLRKTRLDEIPQLFNVLKGEMSITGPRPERPGICGGLEDAIPFYAERTYGVLPGITGLAQVSQGYDESLDDVRAKLLYDHAYGLSLARPRAWMVMEAGILWRTAATVVMGRGQ